MENIANEALTGFTESFNLPESYSNASLTDLAESKYLRDLKMNFKSIFKSEHLSNRETALLGLAIAANATNKHLIVYFKSLCDELNLPSSETSEAIACASLLSSNNVLYRFRHFTAKEKYNQIPAKMRMNIMVNPATGKEFFELMSLAVSAVNGCEMCINAHEQSLVELGSSEERVFDAVRIASILTSVSKVVY